MKTYRLWIDGSAMDSANGESLDSLNPYSGEPWARIARGNAEDVQRAVAAAKRAMEQGPWATMHASERGKIMRRIGDLIVENVEALAEFESRDNGKLIAETRGQIGYLAEHWYYFAGLADKIEGTVVPIDKPDMLAITVREPIGVVAAITAWNSPLFFFTSKCAPALAAGCSVVVKPSEFASVSSLEFAALTKKAGLPDGVINVVTGLGAEVGAPLSTHRDVAKIAFTGSDLTGAKIYEGAARTMKSVAMELGGKSPNIVFDDADLELAAVGVVSGIFGAAGQMCSAGSRLVVQNSIKDAFTARLLELVRDLKLGDPMLPATNVGPISTPPQFQKVLDYIQTANAEGARCIAGGKPAAGPGLTGGQFIEPTIFTDVRNDMRIAQEEVFGPVLCIIGFDDEADAVRIGNDVDYGLVAGVWSRDMGRAVRMSKALKAGTIWVNNNRAYSYLMPFGGMKRSGLGRESGMEAVHEYLETKSIMISTATSAPSNPFIMR